MAPKPILLNETGEKMDSKNDRTKCHSRYVAKKQANIDDDWSSIQDIVNSGNAENIFSTGGF